MNKQELIEELKKEQESIKWSVGDDNYNAFQNGKETAYSISIDLAKQLDEPKKVVVPPIIDKFIRENEDPIYEICAWADHYGSDGRTCSDPELSTVINWFGKNSKEFYQAVINGYEVAKEQLYYVKLPESEPNSTSYYLDIDGSLCIDDEVIDDYKLTEQEIKAIDERYWPFAVKVGN
ncbi:hypothetical protein CUN13_04615 [Enterococcus faecalis]|uniref:DUF1642 domain-containing protein n=1 Tax=Enterococcus faecalis TaxID=1351 RepID=UPI000CF1A5E7|nr:DUF1642 domain-containing protein [Enterococcus faecalis]EHS8008451.1 DUF1642 domain-containing protein [Enterococcus faecalis]EIY8110433.1 DUF1642 domain-containing protein [Enterococcus faecalis]PQB53841.1 hypothetical protein CUN13_04615 [Enterococcus faecalis]PQC99870.1 hypothetical protein CUN39_00665 [Enterococcus faecalis]HBC9394820.1 DUF1642 domain-containing protein [Enterococcus faecalis]